ncbi:PAS domain S-box-containing protein [Catalinimonas alkaloidigena]|uniref:PAS domain-containing protein n=1 Tax=Catalinimonas alkaloidigena TaxID=1075417 RepID=UPI00240685D7|nr:PAS domain-containing protein [Catalinimonas alkaloidigena]MDF9798068.1 PAS domain S-box-containing protein [Catalinimonas alkaloidigena]
MSVSKNIPEKVLSPILCWDVYSMFLLERKNEAKKNNDLRSLEKLHKQYHWQIELEAILSSSYEALVVTDSQQTICWVNDGFTQMTGYPASFALGRRPVFLQGKNTSPETKALIRQKLVQKKFCAADIVNYRKNGEEYLCHVEIHPVFDNQNQLAHFLALEKEALLIQNT